MTYGVTIAQLRDAVDHLNNVAGTPTTPYSHGPDGRRLKANIGHFHLDFAYGGVQVQQMATKSGGTIVPFGGGFDSKRECMVIIQAAIAGMCARVRVLV